MKYLHTMVRISDVDKSLDFYCNKLGLKEVRRMENSQGRFTLYYLAAPGDEDAQVELTHNWDPEVYGEGRNFGHLAFEVDDIYATCERLMKNGVTINRPPRDGYMAFIRSRQYLYRVVTKGKTEAEAGALGLHAELRQVVGAGRDVVPPRGSRLMSVSEAGQTSN